MLTDCWVRLNTGVGHHGNHGTTAATMVRVYFLCTWFLPYLIVCHVSANLKTKKKTTTVRPIISINNQSMEMFEVYPSSAHVWWADACAVWLHSFIFLVPEALGEAVDSRVVMCYCAILT